MAFTYHTTIDFKINKDVDGVVPRPFVEYNGIRVTHDGHEVAVFNCGNPITDHAAYTAWGGIMTWAAQQVDAAICILSSSSFDDWYFDVPGYKEEYIGDTETTKMVYDPSDTRPRLPFMHPTFGDILFTFSDESHD